MPLVRIDHPSGKPAAYRDALSEGVYEAMRSTFAVPEDDRFLILSEHSNTEIVHPDSYLGIPYSNELIIIQITCNDSRSLEKKKSLYAAIVDRLSNKPGLRREDILISLVEVKKENWSFGNGVAQYAQ
jgi:phenylpyruvate tautomerase PptA (4-oxalocrotonate tautomerase family)